MLCLFVTLLYLILFYFVWGFLGFVFVVFFGGGGLFFFFVFIKNNFSAESHAIL